MLKLFGLPAWRLLCQKIRMRKIVIVALLLLAGCDDMPQARSKSELQELIKSETSGIKAVSLENERRLFLRVQELESEQKQAESRIDDLQQQVDDLKGQVSLLP